MSHKIKLHHSELNYRKYRNSPQSKNTGKNKRLSAKYRIFRIFYNFFLNWVLTNRIFCGIISLN